MSEEKQVVHVLSPDGMKILLEDCLPVQRMDGTEGKLAPSKQLTKLKLIGEVRIFVKD